MSTGSEDGFVTTLTVALDQLAKGRPMPLAPALLLFSGNLGTELPESPLEAIARRVAAGGPNDPVLDRLASALHAWDYRDDDWAQGTTPHSIERRELVLQTLGFDASQRLSINAHVPLVAPAELPIIIAEEHERWYDPRRRGASSFYWNHYKTQLLRPRGNWSAEAVDLLGLSVDDVLARLSDPSRSALHPTKGLVMGYVQSGKTSHFAGLIAKAADAGYRFFIVLAGTLDILRKQTQRRLDRDIVGQELLGSEEYGGDSEWASFVSHGGRPSENGSFDWERLTNSQDDYESLKRRLTALEFRPLIRDRPFNDPANLRLAPAKLAVIKKTPTRLQNLCDDLERLRDLRNKLAHVPTLVIDDESDQASINTVDKRRSENKDKRSTTNRDIGRLLSLLPRAQYVGYTATPFANFFIDPADAADLFPRDFIISLRRPDGYMGARDFFDFGAAFEKHDYRSNRNAYVRPVEGPNEDRDNLPRAIDSFVVAGAIKLFREAHGSDYGPFRHHTMLVHHAATQVVHETDKQIVEAIFRGGQRYQNATGEQALKTLFARDFQPVSMARAPSAPSPRSYAELRPFVGECLKRICAGKPVRVVNGHEKYKDDTPDFDAAPVWAILVGGTKLSRGYTVEGLTISYYRRPAGAGDTLMQMGRWFGFRRGYEDLVRLYIGCKEKSGKRTVDLYEAFGAVCMDEEAVRQDLAKYSVEGIKPWQVPPLIQQHLADLPPTSRSKMFNAEIKSLDHAGDWTEKTTAPVDPKRVTANLTLAIDLVDAAGVASEVTVAYTAPTGAKEHFGTLIGTLPGDMVLAFLDGYQWADGRKPVELEKQYIAAQLAMGRLSAWTLLMPQLGAKEDVPGFGRVSTIARTRVSGNRFGVYSDPRHRDVAAAIAGVKNVANPNEALSRATRRTTPVLVLYLVRDRDNKGLPLTIGFGIQYPGSKNSRAIQWGVRNSDKPGEVVVAEREPVGHSPRKRRGK